jgi:hypothetical protein
MADQVLYLQLLELLSHTPVAVADLHIMQEPQELDKVAVVMAEQAVVMATQELQILAAVAAQQAQVAAPILVATVGQAS